MTGYALAALLLGAGVGLAVQRLVAALRPPAAPTGTPKPRVGIRRLGPYGRRVPAAIAAGAVVLLLTRWPVASIATAALVFAMPALTGGAAAEREAAQRLDELVRWAESLRDKLSAAAGLEQAIAASLATAGPRIRPHVQRLVDRLHARAPLDAALRALAVDLADPAASRLIGNLILNARVRGAGLREVLSRLSVNAREQLKMRNRIIQQRSVIRSGTRIILVFTAVVMLALTLLNRDYVQTYSSPAGQAWLALVAGLAATSFVLMRRLAELDAPGALFVTAESHERR